MSWWNDMRPGHKRTLGGVALLVIFLAFYYGCGTTAVADESMGVALCPFCGEDGFGTRVDSDYGYSPVCLDSDPGGYAVNCLRVYRCSSGHLYTLPDKVK